MHARIGVLHEFSLQFHLRRTDLQVSRFHSQLFRSRTELQIKAVFDRLVCGIPKAPVAVRQHAFIFLNSGREPYVRPKIIKISVQRGLMIVVIYFAIRKASVSYGQIEDAGMAITTTLAWRKIVLSLFVDLQVEHWAINQKFSQ